MPDPPNETGFKIGDRVMTWCMGYSVPGGAGWCAGTITGVRYDPDVSNFCFGVDLDIGGGCRSDFNEKLRHEDVILKLAEIVKDV